MVIKRGISDYGVAGDTDHFNHDRENNNEHYDDGRTIAHFQELVERPRTTIVQNQIDGNIVKMLVVLQNKEQRLITFDIPNEPCTVQDLLEQAHISSCEETCISLVADKILGINYIVEDGIYLGGVDSHEESESDHDNVNTPPDNSSPKFGASDENSNFSVAQNENPKYIDGKVAVCPNCGICSLDFNRCSRCKKRLPENVKSVSVTAVAQMKEMMISIDNFYKKAHAQNALAKLEAAMGTKRVRRDKRRPTAKARSVKESTNTAVREVCMNDV